MMNRWIWGYDRVCYCQTRPKWWKIDLDAVTLLGIWHEKGTNSAFALQGLHGSISWKDLLCCNPLCDNPDWCFFATLLWVKPKGDLIQWVKWQLRTVLQILLSVANLHKSRAANWSTRGLEPQHADSDDLERFEQCRQTHSCPSAYCGSTVQYMWPVQTGKELRLQFLRPVKQRCEIDMCLWQHARLWLVHSCSHLQLDRSIKHQRNFSVCQVWQMLQGLKPWKFQQMISVNAADQLDF